MDESDHAHPGQQDIPATHTLHVPRFVTDKEVGLGDIVAKATSAVGVRPCPPCAERARRLNQWLRFTPNQPSPSTPSQTSLYDYQESIRKARANIGQHTSSPPT